MTETDTREIEQASSSLKRSSSAVVVQGVTELITRGTLGSGSVLPSERSLAAHFKVNRKAVRRALMLLADNGVVQRHGPRARTISPGAVEILAVQRNIQTESKTTFMRNCMVILTPHVHEDRSGFLAAISNGVQSGVHQAGYDTIYVHPNKLTQGVIDPSLSELLNSKPAGLLLPESVGTTLSTELLAQCRELEISTVVYGGYQGSAEHDRVLSDHDSGSYALTKWLIEKGRKRIVQLGHSGETYWFDDRRRGLERAIHESGLELLPLEKVPVRFVDRSVWTREYFADTVRHLAGYLFPLLLSKNPVDAIVTVSDSLGHQVIAACEYLGKQPHEDVTVVGYDNYWAYSPDRNEVDVPVAATVDKLNFESGLEMVRLIRQRIAGELPPEPQTRVMPPQLVVVQHNGTVTSSGQRQEAAS